MTLFVARRHTCRPLLQGSRTLFGSSAQRFSVKKELPYSQNDLYQLISDIDSYAKFVPFCTGSNVTRRDGKGMPVKADLRVGYKSFDETFTSDVVCAPTRSVRASANKHPLFEKLVTAWRLSEAVEGQSTASPSTPSTPAKSTVSLDIEYKFANPLYDALSGAVLPKVADQVMQAFEKHARETLSRA
ncbi:Coenzyme Q-binding protein coq10, mitochondrial [Savitreella phatthalungensis]